MVNFVKQYLGVAALLTIMWGGCAWMVEQRMNGAPMTAHYNERWWNHEAGVHFANTLGRFHHRQFSEHFFAVGMACEAPETEPCTSLEGYDLDDKQAVAFAAVAPSVRLGGEAVYTSFPPGAFIGSYGFVYALSDITGLSLGPALRVWNRILQLAAALLMAAAMFRLLPKGSARWAIATLASLPMVVAVEQLHAHYMSMWAHQFYQPVLAAVLLALTFQPSRRNSVALGLLCALGCWIEWTAYLVCISVFFAVLLRSERCDRLSNTVVFAILALSGGLTLVAYYAWLIGLDNYIFTMRVRFGERAMVEYYTWYTWVVSLFQSYGPWLVVAGTACVVAVLAPRRAANGAWVAVIGVSALVLVENVLMFEHSITYTFDRLKWGFLLSALLALSAGAVAARFPRSSVTGLAVLCIGASWVTLNQYTGIYVPYWR